MTDITPLILTFNEQENIGRTLSALDWAREIVIIDSGSTDQTLELARAAHPRLNIVQRQFDTHAAQWNFGLDQVATEWVLTLDADYQLSPELQNEIMKLESPADVIGYSAEFEYRIFGRSLRASSYPPRVVLFRVAKARYVDDGHTQRLRIGGKPTPKAFASKAASPTGETDSVQKLSGNIYHDDRKPLSYWLQAQDRYAAIEARHLLATPLDQLELQDRLRRKIVFAAPVMFLYLLFARGLILDGWPGWFYVAQRTIAELLLSIRLLIEAKKLEDGS